MIEIINLPKDATGFVVVTPVGGELYYYSHKDNYEEALEKAKEGSCKIVVSLGEPGYINVNTIGEGSTQEGRGTDTTYYEITKEEYDRITSYPNWRAELRNRCEANMSDSVRYGYGFYGCGLVERDGKCYYYVSTGNSCD